MGRYAGGNNPLSDLRRILLELISNAVKFRGQLPVKVHISAELGVNECTLCVQDNGMGIDPENCLKVFRPYWKLDRSGPGHGMGLAICRALVALNDGRIWVKSTVGEGARFFVSFPIGV